MVDKRMTRAYFLSVLFIFLWASEVRATNPSETRYPRRQVTVDGLYEACSVVGETAKGDIPYFDCESYVYGVLDTYLAVRESIPKERRACFPADIPPWRALEDAHSLILSGAHASIAGPALIEALRKKYPCH
jgi:hypothetical protein